MNAVGTQAASPSGGAAERPQLVLARLLDDLASLLLRVPVHTYVARPLPGVSGSIGEHVRHILDHVRAMAMARPYGTLTYDRRERGTAVETDRGAALRALLRLRSLLTDLCDEALDSPLVVTSLLARGQEADAAWSTLRRECAFVVSHTVHHQALIATLLAISGVDAPEAFGLAPSTPAPPRS
jgi:hypothetical protein